jgi:hypothetical protein
MTHMTLTSKRLIRAVTMHQPWASASLLPRNDKSVENRPRGTTYRGPVLIHAGLAWDADKLPDINRDTAPSGVILGVRFLVAVTRGGNHDNPWAEHGPKIRHWEWGPEKIVLPKPIKARGQEYPLWRPEEEVMQHVWNQLDELRETLSEALWRRLLHEGVEQ